MIRRLLILCCILYARESLAQQGLHTTGYLFTYFTGNDREGESIRFAVSMDGFRFHALNRNRPVLSSADISSTGGVRDPHILRRHDGRGRSRAKQAAGC